MTTGALFPKPIVTTTGSFPTEIYKNNQLDAAIREAIQMQQQAGVDWYVDGQFGNDIVGLFASRIGLQGDGMPYHVTAKIHPPSSEPDFRALAIAAQALNGKPLKAHLTGPTVIAENCEPHAAGIEYYPPDKADGLRQLTLDIATALAEDVRQLARHTQEWNLIALQIDEPTFAYGADLKIGRESLQKIADAWRNAQKDAPPIILHVCGDYTDIWEELLEMPVDILNLEADPLESLTREQCEAFVASGKRLALGCVPVNRDDLPIEMQVDQQVLFAYERLGSPALYALTPVCGLRESSPDLASKHIKILRQVSQNLPTRMKEAAL